MIGRCRGRSAGLSWRCRGLEICTTYVPTSPINPATCQAPLTFNGLRQPFEPTSSSGGMLLSYSYSASNGATYRASTNLTVITTSPIRIPVSTPRRAPLQFN